MTILKKDPLLAAAQVALVLLATLIGFAMVMVAIGAGAVLTVQRSEALANLATSGAPGETYWAVVAVLVIVAALLFLALCFTVQLKRIADSVNHGDPFQPVNAVRLTRMGWFALGVQACELILTPIAATYGPYASALGGSAVKISMEGDGISLTGLALALVLFILARVFRQGAAMRDDLEGTV